MVAGRYDLDTGEKEVADRILRRRVSEEALARVIARFGGQMQAHLTRSLRTLVPELTARFVHASAADRPDKPPSGQANGVVFRFGLPDVKSSAQLHCDRAAVDLIGHALLGGDPEEAPPSTAADVTALELGLLRSVAHSLDETRRPRGTLLRFDEVGAVRADDRTLAQSAPGAVATLTFAVGFGASRAWLWLDLPHHFLIGLGAQDGDAAAEPAPQTEAYTMPAISIGVDSIMALAPMTLDDLANLKPGDVLETDPAGDGRAVVRARGRNLFAADLGKLGHAHAVRISGPIAPMKAAIEAHQNRNQKGDTDERAS